MVVAVTKADGWIFAALPPALTHTLCGLQVRVAHDVDGVVAPLHAKYRCKNPQCPMVIESARRSAANVSRGAGAVEAREIVLDDATVLLHCKNGVAFNTMDDRYTWRKTSTDAHC